MEIAKRHRVEYIRVIPNCLPQELESEHEEINRWIHSDIAMSEKDKKLFVHQIKEHKRPPLASCFQSFFRPYLSEVNGGTVFPCDSVVLNDSEAHFNMNYAICSAGRVDEYLEQRIIPNFIPFEDCSGCVFYQNNMMLYHFTQGRHEFGKYKNPIKHENFVL
jgi:hypothetical protein